jgi:hypothetical protein
MMPLAMVELFENDLGIHMHSPATATSLCLRTMD